MTKTNLRHWLASSAAAGALSLAMAAPAQAEQATYTFDQPAMPMAAALQNVGRETGVNILVDSGLVRGVQSRELRGQLSADAALMALLDGTGLAVRKTDTNSIMIVKASQDPQGGAAASGSGPAAVEALIVTAQKREEDIQDVPIAISAFSQKSLDEQKIEGGFDLLKAIPNVTFSKTNFTSYNFSIRGVGTKAISATTDPGVAVAFNNSPLIHNRLFEQEYFDVERVEVLRGPQGTLYGRNATSGVINVISAKPDLNSFDGWLKGEVGNYHSKRLSAMVNVPLVEDVLAIRLAGALTDRQGYDFNTGTGSAVNGRDLWSARLTVGFKPTERIRGNLIWERFEEDDDRSRTGKQLCHRDDGPTAVGSVDLLDGPPVTASFTEFERSGYIDLRRSVFGQGCQPGSLYDAAAFGTPNGLSFPFILAPVALAGGGLTVGMLTSEELYGANGYAFQGVVQPRDPYGGKMQSRDLRSIDSLLDPVYRAKADLLELNVDIDVTPYLTLTSQTAYNEDEVYSFQDYNRFNSDPVFTDTTRLTKNFITAANPTGGGPSPFYNFAPGGIYCDPQIGCSSKLAGFDISQAVSKQFSQEFRIQSSFDGSFNFSLGANYIEFETLNDYYVMFNVLTAMAETPPVGAVNIATFPGGVWARGLCGSGPFGTNGGFPRPSDDSFCPYVDPNPVESINGEGHNYFRSKNPYELESWSVFGESYLNVGENFKITAGLRYTDDTKTFVPVPSQTLLAPSLFGGGLVSKGYPEDPPIVQSWGEWTGRLGIDWQPDLDLTDQTLLYAFYSRGYKGGGANPPTPGFATKDEYIEGATEAGLAPFILGIYETLGYLPILKLTGVEYGETFDPEFVNAFEIGAKNTLLDSALTLNATAFYYDYEDYQVSQIRDRTAVNENFDAEIWGLELETTYAPSRNLRINANLGYLDTRIADGEQSIDIMNRTQGDPNYVLAKPWVQMPSNCVIPTHVGEYWLENNSVQNAPVAQYWTLCGGVLGLLSAFFGETVFDPAYGALYDHTNYPELNGGAGLKADLGGNELPNAPHWTANIGAQYGMDMLDGWRATIRGDVYWQSQSWHRVYNSDPYDKLHGWYNANLSVWVERPDDGLKIELYVKNLLDDTPITDAFLNSDDTGLTTNVFTLDPRLIGLSIRKEF